MVMRMVAQLIGSRNLRHQRKSWSELGILVGLDHQKLSLVKNGHYDDGMGFDIFESRSVEFVCENMVVELVSKPEDSQVSYI